MPSPSLLLIHGASSGAWIWESWRLHLRSLGWQVNVLDLRGHGRSLPIDFSTVTLEDYVADVTSVTGQIEAAEGVAPVLGGWDSGGLIAMMHAAEHKRASALLLLSPGMPVEVGGKAALEEVRRVSGDVIGPEMFGVHPADREKSRETLFDLSDEEMDVLLARIREERESGIAYRQQLRGMISVAEGAIECPSLVLYGESEAEQTQARCKALAAYLRGESMAVPGAAHWGIVCHDEAVAEAASGVDGWLRALFGGT